MFLTQKEPVSDHVTRKIGPLYFNTIRLNFDSIFFFSGKKRTSAYIFFLGTQPLNFTKTAKMLEPRAFAASIALDNSILWVTGGSGNNSTEWIDTRVSYYLTIYKIEFHFLIEFPWFNLPISSVLFQGGKCKLWPIWIWSRPTYDFTRPLFNKVGLRYCFTCRREQ